jgi:hypothetical protein
MPALSCRTSKRSLFSAAVASHRFVFRLEFFISMEVLFRQWIRQVFILKGALAFSKFVITFWLMPEEGPCDVILAEMPRLRFPPFSKNWPRIRFVSVGMFGQ